MSKLVSKSISFEQNQKRDICDISGEQKMTELERIEFAHFYMWYLWDNDSVENDENFQRATREWKRLKKYLDEEPWADGKHYGDCTNVALTCMRCYLGNYKRTAKKIMEL